MSVDVLHGIDEKIDVYGMLSIVILDQIEEDLIANRRLTTSRTRRSHREKTQISTNFQTSKHSRFGSVFQWFCRFESEKSSSNARRTYRIDQTIEVTDRQTLSRESLLRSPSSSIFCPEQRVQRH